MRISSAKLTKNSPSAAGNKSITWFNGGVGNFSEGRPLGISPTTATPCWSRFSHVDNAIPATTTTSAAGKRGAIQRSGSITASATTATATVAPLTFPISFTASTSCGIGSLALMLTPVSFPSCPMINTTTTPWM